MLQGVWLLVFILAFGLGTGDWGSDGLGSWDWGLGFRVLHCKEAKQLN